MELFGLVSVAALLVLAAIGPVIAPHPTQTANPAARLLPPGGANLLGTDENGMDILSRILAAPRVDVSVAFIAITIAVAVGTPLGVLAGFFEGTRRRAASVVGETMLRLLDVIQAFPVFILAMVLVAIRGATTENIIIAVAFVNMPTFLRIARAEILSLRQRPYAEAAQSIGATDSAIAFRHLLPNALPPLIAQVSVTMGFAILLTAGLSYVGAGVQPPTPELGGMIASGAKVLIIGHWWPSLFPGIALGLIVFSFAAAGQAFAHLFEPHGADAEGAAARDAVLGVPVSIGAVTLADPPVPAATQHPSTDPIECPDAAAPPVVHRVSRPADCLLTVDDLSVEFTTNGPPTRVLSGISLWVAAGEAFGIVGEAGSGKSVLVRALLRLLPEEGQIVSGDLRFRGDDILRMTPEKLRALRGVEFAPILPNAKAQLSPVTKIADLMVLVYRSHARVSREAALARAVEALRMVGIQDPERRLNAYPHELSGGMAQRVCIALALLHEPALVVADEPTVGLDVTVQRQVLDQMVSAARERGAAQLIVTRDLGIVAQYCQRVAVMQGGRIVETGYVRDVLRTPDHPYTRELIASVELEPHREVREVAAS